MFSTIILIAALFSPNEVEGWDDMRYCSLEALMAPQGTIGCVMDLVDHQDDNNWITIIDNSYGCTLDCTAECSVQLNGNLIYNSASARAVNTDTGEVMDTDTLDLLGSGSLSVFEFMDCGDTLNVEYEVRRPGLQLPAGIPYPWRSWGSSTWKCGIIPCGWEE